MTYHVKEFVADWQVVDKRGNFVVMTNWRSTADKIAKLLTVDSQMSDAFKCEAFRREDETCTGQNPEGGVRECPCHGCKSDCPLEGVRA